MAGLVTKEPLCNNGLRHLQLVTMQLTKVLLLLRTVMSVRERNLKSGCQVQSKESVISHLQYLSINKMHGSDKNYMDNVE